MKKALIFLVAFLVTPALPGVAGAHVEVTPSTAPAGKEVSLALEVGHGCDGEATTSLEVLLPEGTDSVAAQPVAGWKESTPAGKLVWRGGPLPDHEAKEFPFTAEFFGKKGDEQVFRILQGCQNGAATAWIQEASAGAEPTYPASVLTLTSTASPPAGETATGSGSTAGPTDPTGSTSGATGATGDNAVDDLAEATAGDVEKGEEEDDGGGIILPIIGVVLIAASVTAFIVIQRAKRQRS